MSGRPIEGPDGDEELSAWAEDFKRGGDTAPPISAVAVMEEAERAARKERRAWASQIVGLVLAIANFLGMTLWTRSWLVAALSAVVLPTLLAEFGWFVHLRQSAGKRADESVAAHVAWMVRRAGADLRVVRANRLALAFLALAFWVWLPLFVLSHADRYAGAPSRLAISGIVALAVFAGGFWRVGTLVRRAETDDARWRSIEASFEARS